MRREEGNQPQGRQCPRGESAGDSRRCRGALFNRTNLNQGQQQLEDTERVAHVSRCRTTEVPSRFRTYPTSSTYLSCPVSFMRALNQRCRTDDAPPSAKGIFGTGWSTGRPFFLFLGAVVLLRPPMIWPRGDRANSSSQSFMSSIGAGWGAVCSSHFPGSRMKEDRSIDLR